MEIIRFVSQANITEVDGNVIHLKNRKIETNVIICATGYRPVLDLLKAFEIEVNQETKFPLIKNTGESAQIRNLFFCGPLAYRGLRNLFIHGFIKMIPGTLSVIQKRLRSREVVEA